MTRRTPSSALSLLAGAVLAAVVLSALAVLATEASAAGTPRIAKAPSTAKAGQRISVLARDLPAHRYVLRLVVESNPGGESTPCSANIGPSDVVAGDWAFRGRVPRTLTCRSHGTGPSLGRIAVTPGRYLLTLCVPRGSACADGPFLKRSIRIVR